MLYAIEEVAVADDLTHILMHLMNCLLIFVHLGFFVAFDRDRGKRMLFYLKVYYHRVLTCLSYCKDAVYHSK